MYITVKKVLQQYSRLLGLINISQMQKIFYIFLYYICNLKINFAEFSIEIYLYFPEIEYQKMSTQKILLKNKFKMHFSIWCYVVLFSVIKARLTKRRQKNFKLRNLLRDSLQNNAGSLASRTIFGVKLLGIDSTKEILARS